MNMKDKSAPKAQVEEKMLQVDVHIGKHQEGVEPGQREQVAEGSKQITGGTGRLLVQD